MKCLSSLIVVGLIILGIIIALPILSFGFALLCGGIFLVFWILPIWIIATSDVTTGGEKIAWLLAIVFLSWFAWVFYFFLAPLKPRRGYDY